MYSKYESLEEAIQDAEKDQRNIVIYNFESEGVIHWTLIAFYKKYIGSEIKIDTYRLNKDGSLIRNEGHGIRSFLKIDKKGFFTWQDKKIKALDFEKKEIDLTPFKKNAIEHLIKAYKYNLERISNYSKNTNHFTSKRELEEIKKEIGDKLKRIADFTDDDLKQLEMEDIQ